LQRNDFEFCAFGIVDQQAGTFQRSAFARESVGKQQRLSGDACERAEAKTDGVNLRRIVTRRLFCCDFDNPYGYRKFMHNLSVRSPLLGQEGWPCQQETSPKASFKRARTGWSFWTDHPVCAFKGGFAYFLDAQPPLLSQEGTTRYGNFGIQIHYAHIVL